MRLTRSILSVPASNERMIAKAVASEADIVMIDLEDAVAPNAKAQSRPNVVRALRELDWGRSARAYRVNGLDTPFFYRDIIDVLEPAGDRVEVVVIPKVGRPEDLAVADTLMTQIEMSRGLPVGAIKLQAQIESAAGLVQVDGIARAAERLESLAFGPGDFVASIRMPASSIGGMDWWDERYPGHRLHYPMIRLVVAARAASLQPVDGPLADYRDLDAFRRSCVLARGLGYDGKWCIHPGQIEIANKIFVPAAEEIARARRVVEAYEEATATGQGVITVDGTMVDGASIRMAQTTLELARQAGVL